jgi:hypothetical protein
MKTRLAAATLALAALVCFPSAALAHTGSATVSCTGVQYSFVNFGAGVNTVNYLVKVDDTAVKEGTFVLNEAGGTAGHLAIPLTIYDNHRVRAYSWWGPTGTVNGETRSESSPPLADKVVQCPATPPPITTPSPPAPVAPPVNASSTTGGTPPMIVVAGQQVSSTPALRLYAQNACAARHARITVTGPQMRQVRFSVKGRRARTVKVAPGARRVSALVALRRRGAPVQKVTTHITFRNGASPRTLVAVARRCSSGAVVPKFTG